MWQHPLSQPQVVAKSNVSEITPFIWRNRLYKVENYKASEAFPGEDIAKRFHEDGCRIVDVESGKTLSIPWTNHYFTTATVWQDRIYLFGGDYEWDRPWWHIRHIEMIHSDDLAHWSRPQIVLKAADNENLFNNAVVHDGQRFVLLYETDDPAYPKFTFKFAVSDDLEHWTKLPKAIFGNDKYVGGPAMYFEGGRYYILYVNDLGGKWDTRITRSRDLVQWEEAPSDRPFLSPDYTHETNPEDYPGVFEINASDAEMIEWQGHVLVWWNGGDQCSCGDHKLAEFAGTRRELCERFFAD